MPVRNVAGKGQSTREPPRLPDYVEGEDYAKTLERSKIGDVIVLTGPPGFGKTTAARQVCRKMWHQPRCESMYHEVECISPESFKEDMDRISADYSIFNERGDVAKLTWEKVLRYTLEDIAENCPDMQKYFVVDTCRFTGEIVEKVLAVLDHFCEHLNRTQSPRGHRNKMLTIFVITNAKGLSNKFSSIGKENFVTFNGLNVEETVKLIRQEEDFSEEEESIVQEYAERINEKRKIKSPLGTKVFLRYLNFVEDFLEPDHEQEGLSGANEHDDEDLKFFRKHIELCFENFNDDKKKFLIMLSLIDATEVLSGPLVAFMETLHPGEGVLQARIKVGAWMQELSARHLCEKEGLRGTPVLYRIDRSIQKTFSKFSGDFKKRERIEILRDTLLSLIRQKPTSGSEKLVETFIRHADRLCCNTDQMLSELKDHCDESMLFLIKVLQCELYSSMGECYIAQQNVLEGIRHYYKAWAKCCEAVKVEHQPEYVVTEEWAMKLYDAGQNTTSVQSDLFVEYMKSLPMFSPLTKVAQYHMTGIEKQDIVGGHLTDPAYHRLLQLGRILNKEKEFDVQKMAQLYMGELPMKLLLGWAKVHHHVNGVCEARFGTSYSAETSDLVHAFKLSDGKLQPEYYQLLSEIVFKLGDRVRQNHGVFLLHRMVAGRYMLHYKHQSVSAAEADGIHNEWVGISCGRARPGQAPPEQGATDGGQSAQVASGNDALQERTEVFENGIVICHLEKDKYHELLCKMGALLALGLKTTPNIAAEQKVQLQAIMCLLREGFTGLPRKLHHRLTSRVYRTLAQFYSSVARHIDIATSIVNAVHHLRLSLPEDKLSPGHVLLSHLVQDLEKYQQLQHLRLELIEMRDNETLQRLKKTLENFSEPNDEHVNVQKLTQLLKDLKLVSNPKQESAPETHEQENEVAPQPPRHHD